MEDWGIYRPILSIQTNNGNLNVSAKTITLQIGSPISKLIIKLIYLRILLY